MAYVLVSITIWIVARFSPFEWQLPNSNIDPLNRNSRPLKEIGHEDIQLKKQNLFAQEDFESLHSISGKQQCNCNNVDHTECHHSENGYMNQNLDLCSEAELLCSENDFTLKNSFWFAIGTLMQQGSDLNPKVTNKFQ